MGAELAFKAGYDEQKIRDMTDVPPIPPPPVIIIE